MTYEATDWRTEHRISYYFWVSGWLQLPNGSSQWLQVSSHWLAESFCRVKAATGAVQSGHCISHRVPYRVAQGSKSTVHIIGFLMGYSLGPGSYHLHQGVLQGQLTNWPRARDSHRCPAQIALMQHGNIARWSGPNWALPTARGRAESCTCWATFTFQLFLWRSS